jgi:hypothetical protein
VSKGSVYMLSSLLLIFIHPLRVGLAIPSLVEKYLARMYSPVG